MHARGRTSWEIFALSRAIERALKMRQAGSMSITPRGSLRSAWIALALLPIFAIAVIADAVIAAMPASAAEPFHFPASLRSGKKIGDLVPGLSALNDVVKMFPAAPQDYP